MLARAADGHLMVTSNPLLDHLGGNPLAAMQELANRVRAGDSPYFDFAVGDPDEPTPMVVREGLVGAAEQGNRRSDAWGSAAFREAAAGWVGRRHQVQLDPARQILPSAGSKEAIFQLPFAVIDRSQSSSVIWGAPGYPIYGRGAILAGAEEDVVTLTQRDDWLLRLERLSPERLDRAQVAWINYPHNPTGASATRKYFEEQVNVAREHGILLCSDEAYQDLWYEERPPSVLEACDHDAAGVLAFVSLSKRSGMTGYRAGAIVGDQHVISTLVQLRASSGTVPPPMIQASATAAFRDDAHAEERRLHFAAKRLVLLRFLGARGVEVSGSQASLYIWLRVPDGDDQLYASLLLDEGIIATPGRAFGDAGRGWMRFALVPSLEDCVRAVEVWGAAIDAGRLPNHG